jgi:hypothetical protein
MGDHEGTDSPEQASGKAQTSVLKVRSRTRLAVSRRLPVSERLHLRCLDACSP